MRIGKPKLAVWRRTDQTVRLFEMDNTGVFVQLTAFSGPTGNDVVVPTVMEFSQNGDWLVTLDKVSKASDNIQMRSTDFAGNTLYSSTAVITGAATQDTYFGVISTLPDGTNSVQASFGQQLIYGANDGTFAGLQSRTAYNYSFTVFDMDEACTKAVFLRPDFLRFASVSYSSSQAQFTLTPAPSLGARVPKCAEWSRDGRFCAVGYDNGDVELYSVSGSSYTLLSTMNVGDIVNQVRWRFDCRILAVGHGVSPKTTLYKRKGNVLYTPTDLAGMGTDLRWTADGQYLCDAVLKKAYRWTGDMTMVGSDATMTNIPSGVNATAISPHVDQPIANGLIYDQGFQAVVNKTIDLTNLKFALMDGTVSFNVSANSAAAILSGKEVTSADFPAGGKVLQNVSQTFPSPAFSKIVADDLLVATSVSLDFGQALLYDATHDTPLILYNYGSQHMDAFFTQRFAFDHGVVTLST